MSNGNEMIECGVMVVVTIPKRMVKQIEKEIATCIGFGNPTVTLIYDVPAAQRTEDVVKDL